MPTPVTDPRAKIDARLRGFCVLIADDSSAIRALYRAGLSLAVPDLQIATADDGIETLRLARELLPDVILMDISMPGVDGLEATRRIKADPQTRRTRVIAVTGTMYESATILEAGCDAFLLKPVTPSQLLAEIVRVLRV